MSVSSISIPNKYSAAYGNIVYQVSSTNQSTKYKFRFVFDVFMNDERIARLKVTPQNPNWGQVDLSRIVKSYVQSTPLNMGSLNQNEPISKANWGWLDKDWLKLNVYVGEEYANDPTEEPTIYDGLGNQGDPDYDPSGDRYVFNAVKEWFEGKNYDLSPFYLNTTDLPGPYDYNSDDHRFLTDAPRIQYVRRGDYQTLSAINFNNIEDYSTSDPIYAAVFEFYDDNNQLLTTGITHNLVVNGGWRYNCSGNTENQYVYPDYYKKYISYVGVGEPNLDDMGIGVPPLTKYWRVSLHKSVDDAVPPTPTPTATLQPTPTATPTPPLSFAFATNTPTPTQTQTQTPAASFALPTNTPSSTPTHTPTPTTTDYYDCLVGCKRYGIYNYSKTEILYYEYVDCLTGITISDNVKAASSEFVCACGTPVRTSGSTSYDINDEGACR